MLSYTLSCSIVLSSTLLLSACGGDTSAPAAGITDTQLAEKVYLDKRTPDNFFTNEETIAGDSFYTISHLKNIELLSPAEKIGLPQYELSTDDFTQALNWSETVASKQTVYKQLVDNSDTTLYYQFTRVDLNNPEFIQHSRVYKASALDRSGVDLGQSGSFQGKIVSATYTTTIVKQLIEYLWTFSFSNNYGHAVLESNTIESELSITHTLLEAKLITTDVDTCDTIEIFESNYSIDKSSGEIWKTTTSLRTLQTTFNGTFATLCE